jgi:tripartite-type tricarboxylate transporter receptor subunit TctC
VRLACALFLSLVLVSSAAAQEWPAKPVRMIVPFPPGGSADLMPRAVAERLAERWGQPVIVENRPGAAGNIGADIVYRAEPDGYTLLSAPPPPLVINRFLYRSLPYDSSQFVPIYAQDRTLAQHVRPERTRKNLRSRKCSYLHKNAISGRYAGDPQHSTLLRIHIHSV